jgi:hypothetical protein
MELLIRHRLAAGVMLILVVSLLGWQLLPHDSRPGTPPTPAARDVTSASQPTAEQSAPLTRSSAAVSMPADPLADAPDSTLRGRAFDAITDEPVRRFEITWREPIGEPRKQFNSRRRTFETTDGRFEYTDVPPGKWGMIVTARGYQRFELPALQVTSGAEQEVMVPLQKGYALRGRVYDQATGAGIAASIDVLDPLASTTFRSRAQGTEQASSEDGNFVIEGLPPGRTAVAVEAKNYTSRTVVVEVGANTSLLEIGLSGGAKITGLFTTAAGDPISGGSVMLYRADGSLAGTGNTDAAGTFELRDIEAGQYQLVGRYGSATVAEDVALSGGTATVQLMLEAGRTIRGTVTGLRPELLDKVNITVRRDGQAMWAPNRVNDRGEFELNDVAPGPLRVVADVNRTREVSKSIQMPADADVTVHLDFAPAAALSGRVTRNNKPLAGLLVIARPADARASGNSHDTKTSSAGAYSLQNLEPGEYVLVAGTFISRPLQVQGEVVFDIDIPGGDLAGRLLDDSSGLPLAGASVDLYFADATVSNLRINRLTDHLGQFTFEGTVPNEYLLVVYRPGYRLYRERVSFDTQSAPMAIRLRQDKGVEIRGRDAATGRPVPEIMVFESNAGRSGLTMNLTLDESGLGYLPGGLAGSKLLLVAPGAGSVEIPAWNGAALDLRFGAANK